MQSVSNVMGLVEVLFRIHIFQRVIAALFVGQRLGYCYSWYGPLPLMGTHQPISWIWVCNTTADAIYQRARLVKCTPINELMISPCELRKAYNTLLCYLSGAHPIL